MRPGDPRLRRQLAPARRELSLVIGSGIVGSLLVIGQAWAVTGLVLAALRGADLAGWAVAVVGVFLGRALAGWAGDVAAARAAVVVGTDLRRRIVGAVLRAGTPRPTGELSALA